MKKKESKIREIIEKYQSTYYKQDWDTGRETAEWHIVGILFDKLEKELTEYAEHYGCFHKWATPEHIVNETQDYWLKRCERCNKWEEIAIEDKK